MYAFLVLTAAIFFTTGGVAMKASAGMTKLTPSILFFFLFAFGAALQAIALRHAELGVTYVVVLGVEAVLAVVFGSLIFSERLSLVKGAGVFAVVLGITLMHAGETGPPTEPTSTVVGSTNVSSE